MPLSWNEIRDRAIAFAREWEGTSNEHADAKSFMDDFFEVFGVPRKKVALFEKAVQKLDGKAGFIDLFWPGKLVIEFKSRGKDLKRALAQANDYALGLTDKEAPKNILVCDFERFKLYDLEAGTEEVFLLSELPKKVHLFGFIAGYEKHSFADQDPVNIEAAELMGILHDELKAIGYTGHDLEVLLVRLLFCLFADDTGIFMPRGILHGFIKDRTAPDGTDIARMLTELFEILNTREIERLTNLDDHLKQFPYVNGKLFQERIRTAHFTSRMRDQLLVACSFDWSLISPAVFGALFQSIMDDKARRNLGAHYTSEKNIMKLIKPLFLDDLRAELETIKRNPTKLRAFHDKLRSLTFFDPACGCGNFLVISYRELRLLELDVLRALQKSGQLELDVRLAVKCDVDQFYGIEIEEFPAQIAQVALWLVDHQMNNLASSEFGQPILRIPLTTSAKIVHGNALRIDWEEVVPKEKLSYILGNPPFVGARMMNTDHRSDMDFALPQVKDNGLLDYVSAWYIRAAYLIRGTAVECAFVSTNSVTQGEQVAVLWTELLKSGIAIQFAHRTFDWRNEAKGVAAVECVIIGFSTRERTVKLLWDYDSKSGEPHRTQVGHINPYLVNAPDILLHRRHNPLCHVPEIGIGSQPIDDGNYLFTPEGMSAFIELEPQAKKYFKRWLGSDEFLNGYERWCLWLGDCDPSDLRRMPHVLKRVEAVRHFREKSRRAATVKLASRPTRFQVENIPKAEYLIIPKVSSERRFYIPIGFESPATFVSDLVFVVRDATRYHFGVLSSIMHMSWTRQVAGRLESRYRYSKDIVYNNFPWPVDATPKQKEAIEKAAQAVLDTRAKFPGASLADLYDPLTMPPELLKAHQTLDKAVDAAYGKRSSHGAAFTTEAERVAFLFEQYQKLAAPLVAVEKGKSNQRA